MAVVGGQGPGRSLLLGDGDSMEGWGDWRGQPGGEGGVSLGGFEMAAELPLIKFFAVSFTLLYFVILVDGVKCDYLAFMESSACKPFTDDRTIRENGSLGCWASHPLNSWG